MEKDLKLIYQNSGIEDLELSLTTIEVDIHAEQQALQDITDPEGIELIKETIKELNYEAAYVAGLIDLYYDNQQNSLENQSTEE